MIRITFNQAWTGDADCLHCTVRDSVLFAGLTKDDFEKLHDPISQFTLKPGTALYKTGDASDSLFTVRSGLIKQLKFLPDGTQRILRIAHGTSTLGLEAMVADTYQHDAIALRTSEVCRLPAKMIRQLSEKKPVLYGELMRHWQRALNDADSWILELSTGSAKARIARLLLYLASVDAQKICYLVSREDMGAMLGITPETASRIIASFKRDKLIREQYTDQYTVDFLKLQKIANE
ncbi:Crp/Fnr family transcriptional regulator [Achromatium sp. WMS1]|nr:Crp/Fnr family transcriptional regulator [Achromatium sp. WMS1]